MPQFPKRLTQHKFFQFLLLLFLWGVVPLVTVELIAIVFEPFLFNKTFYQYDPDLGFRVRPNTLGSNEFGFNDRDYALQKSPGTLRIMVVGDSFSWAGGREGNYTALLENQLNALPNKTAIEVINAGFPMTHTGEQLMMLKKYGLQFNPDVVVLGFFVGNDFIDADPYRKRIVVNDVQIDIDKRKEVKILGYPIIPQSRLWLFVQQKYKVFQEMIRVQNAAHADEPGTFSEETFLGIQKARMDFCNLALQRQGQYQANIDFIFQSIAEMDALLKSKNIKLVVAIYPDEFQVNQQLTTAIFNKFNLKPEDYDLELMQKLLKGYLESQNIPYVDLLNEFQQTGKTETLYLLRDTHWNEAGNQLAADILTQYLQTQLEPLKSSSKQ